MASRSGTRPFRGAARAMHEAKEKEDKNKYSLRMVILRMVILRMVILRMEILVGSLIMILA